MRSPACPRRLALLLLPALLLTASCRSSQGGHVGFGRIGRDLRHAPASLLADGRETWTDTDNLSVFAAMGAAALVAETFEDEEERWVDRWHVYNEGTSDAVSQLGDGGLLLASSLGLAGAGALFDSEREYEAGKVVTEALAVTGISTLVLKAVVPDVRPSSKVGDFPSGHSSMSMAAATALDSYYGHRVGVPAFLGALAVGVQRIDSKNHDIAAVASGFALGYFTARSVARRERGEAGAGEGATLVPFVDPSREVAGLALRWSF